MLGKQFSSIVSVVLAVMAMTLMSASSSWAQKYKTLHTFGGTDGQTLRDGLIFDGAGNLYGTAELGGSGDGVVFELSPNSNGRWTESVLHTFTYSDGAAPFAGVIFDASGNLYGTTEGGGAFQEGTVFKLTPNSDGTWTESVLHSFDGADGAVVNGGLVFDQAGKLYGTTDDGGDSGKGVAFQMTPNSDGTWTEKVIYSFTSRPGGYFPNASLILDSAGNLYGTAESGGRYGGGVVFKLTSNPDGSWTETTLHAGGRSKDGSGSQAALIFDAAGNLYGTDTYGGTHGWGTVFELTPNSNGQWTEHTLHQFSGADGGQPYAGLIFDATGNLYGTTTVGGAHNYGVVFKLTPESHGWKYRVLYAFTNNPGSNPWGSAIFDGAGNLYGTTRGDNITTLGTVFEIIP
jgi:uncharacterized repeat protein (TIGR03803 family)